MTPDEVLVDLDNAYVKVSRSGLNQYTKKGYTPHPETGSLGRGQGRYTSYPSETPREVYAAWNIIKNGVPSDQVADTRTIALDFLNNPNSYLKIFHNDQFEDINNNIRLCVRTLSVGNLVRDISRWIIWALRFESKNYDPHETYLSVLLKETDQGVAKRLLVSRPKNMNRYEDYEDRTEYDGTNGEIRYLTRNGVMYSLQTNGLYSVDDTAKDELVNWENELKKFDF